MMTTPRIMLSRSNTVNTVNTTRVVLFLRFFIRPSFFQDRRPTRLLDNRPGVCLTRPRRHLRGQRFHYSTNSYVPYTGAILALAVTSVGVDIGPKLLSSDHAVICCSRATRKRSEQNPAPTVRILSYS